MRFWGSPTLRNGEQDWPITEEGHRIGEARCPAGIVTYSAFSGCPDMVVTGALPACALRFHLCDLLAQLDENEGLGWDRAPWLNTS